MQWHRLARRNAPIIKISFFAFSVFPLIVARVSNQDPDLNDVQPEEEDIITVFQFEHYFMDYCSCLLYTSPSPRDLSTSRMPSSA